MKTPTALLKGYEVSWISKLPMISFKDGTIEGDFDRATWTTHDCRTKTEARKLGRKIATDTTLPIQCAHIRQFEIVQRRGLPDKREYIGEVEEIA